MQKTFNSIHEVCARAKDVRMLVDLDYEVSSKVKGEEGRPVTITVYRNEEYIDFTLTRASVKVYH